jgi:hypothetical protein
MLAIKLVNNVSCEHICQQTQKMINNYLKEYPNNNNLLLILDIKEINDGNFKEKIYNLPLKT